MKITEQRLRQLIRRALHESNEMERWSQAPEGSSLGRIAFADQRDEVPAGLEPNNSFEKEVLEDFEFLIGVNGDLSSEALTAVRSALSQGHYKDVLYYSPAPTFYRGMYLSEKQAIKLLGIKPQDLPEPGESRIFSEYPFEFRSNKDSGVSSWTTSYKVALGFGEDLAWEDDTWAVVLVARAVDNPKNFLDLKEFYRIIDDYHAYQKECIALGPVWVSEFRIIKPG